MEAPTDASSVPRIADRVGLGVRGDSAHDLAERAVVDGVVGRRRPVRRGRLRRRRGGRGHDRGVRPGVRRRLAQALPACPSTPARSGSGARAR